VRFSSDVDGTVTALKFLQGFGEHRYYTGSLWSADGTLWLPRRVTDETASGWQTVDLDHPVTITAGTTYVASYHTSVGVPIRPIWGSLRAGVDSGPLHVPTDGGAFKADAGFPDQDSSAYYWRTSFQAQGRAAHLAAALAAAAPESAGHWY
jgi:hypothetical protein